MNWIPVTSLTVLLGGLWFLSKEVAATAFPIWDESAFVLVVFGSVALSMISMGWRKCNAALYSVFDFLIPRKKYKVDDVVEKLVSLSQAQRDFDFERWNTIELNPYLDSCKEVVRDGIVTSKARHNMFLKKAELINLRIL